jgi:protein tyrosine phosphatase (PTP) superfamily phosphohydrolase (DUF442 family)
MRDPDDIECWQRINLHLTTSGKLEERDFDRLAKMGIAHVINLALAKSPGILPDEAERWAAHGIAYTHLPVPFDAPSEAQFDAFCEAVEQSVGQNVHAHCVRNWRVSAFVYLWHLKRCDMPEPQARSFMAQQWTPENSTHEDAPAWARFIAGIANG